MNRPPLRSLVNPLMVVLVIALVANVAVFVAWTAPRGSARLGVTGGATDVAAVRSSVEPRLQLARDTYGRLARAEADLIDFRSRLITRAGGAELLGMMSAAGASVGLNLDDATMQFVALDELGVQQLAMTFPVVGSYDAVRNLLDELVELPVFLVVDGIGLQAPVGGDPAADDDPVRVDLAISVFLEDPELAAAGPVAAAPTGRLATTQARALERLRSAVRDGDPEDIADALVDQLAGLPALPVDPDGLIVDLERVDSPRERVEPQRNLFAVVLPPPPPVVIVDEPEPEVVEPEPQLPVRLVGVLRIDGRYRASLSDDRDLFVAQAGDTLPNGVQIVEVGADYAEVVFDGERTRLVLEGNGP